MGQGERGRTNEEGEMTGENDEWGKERGYDRKQDRKDEREMNKVRDY